MDQERSATNRSTGARNELPGQRADLPAGTLRRIPPEPQGDENREPPEIAPTGPEPAPRVPPPQPPGKE